MRNILSMRNNKKSHNGINLKNKKNVVQLLAGIFEVQEIVMLIPLILLIIVISIFKPVFLSINNIQAIFRSLPFWGIIAIGETIVILVGEFDISVGSNVALGGIVSTFLMTQWNINILLAIIIGIMASTLVGLVNGTCIVKLKIPAFITTIAMLYIARGLTKAITQARVINNLPKKLVDFGSLEPLGTSVAFLVFLFLFIIFELILRNTVYGRQVYATGDNKEVARLAGINVTFIKMSTFVITGFLCGLSGVLISAQLATGSPHVGNGWELTVIAATAIGGISLMGGSGSLIGTFIGILIMSVLYNGLVLLGINPFVQNILIGIIMISAVILDTRRRNRKLGIT